MSKDRPQAIALVDTSFELRGREEVREYCYDSKDATYP